MEKCVPIWEVKAIEFVMQQHYSISQIFRLRYKERLCSWEGIPLPTVGRVLTSSALTVCHLIYQCFEKHI